MHMNRRRFFRISGTGLAVSSLAALGFSPTAALAETRQFKLTRATETRNVCPYCSVSCGVLIYSTGDKSNNTPGTIIHIEGDPDNPVNRGALCPKGAGLRDMVQSANRLKWPQVREPGRNAWQRISWPEAFDRIAKHMKADRDAHFVAKNDSGVTVNRWSSTAFLASSAAPNEAGYLTVKTLRALGMTSIDTQARI